jgi:hypothetical protein
MTPLEIFGLGLAAFVLLLLVLDTRRRRREQRRREQRRRDSAACAGVAGGTAIAPSGSDCCACGHDRDAHKDEVQHGWTACTTKGCGCVLFVMAMQQRQGAPGDA